MSGLDPVEVLAAEVRAMRRRMCGATWNAVTAEDREIARQLLTKVWVQDWRIVRLDFADDEVTCEITDEWSPIPEPTR